LVLWLICLFIGSSIILMRYCPDTPMANALRRYLAVQPVRWLTQRKRSDLFYFLLVAGFAMAGGEVFAVLGPEVVLMYSADLAIYLDLIVISSMLAVGSRLKYAFDAVRSLASSLRNRTRRTLRRNAREVATRRKGEVATSDNDDEDSWQSYPLAA
jgi:hypothetical protein